MISAAAAINIRNTIFETGTITDCSIQDLISLLEFADDLYFNGDESIISDIEYDNIKHFVHQEDPTNVYFLGVGSDVRGDKVKLPFEMGSLDQIYQGEIEDWVNKHKLQNHDAVITYKLDGFSCMIVYNDLGDPQIAYSRGNGTEGADITRHIRNISSVPTSIGHKLVVRGELIISPDNFKKVAKIAKSRSGRPYKNPRNTVAGLMNSKEVNPEALQYVDFIAYEIVKHDSDKNLQLFALKAHKFTTPPVVVVPYKQLNDEYLTKLLNDARNSYDYEIDGLVVDVNDSTKRAEMNPTRNTLNPAYSIKYKVADTSNYAEVKVTTVSFNVSKDGYLKPTINLEPTNLVGVTIQNCTGFNAKFIFDNKIGPGAIIGLVRSGDVIPFCSRVVKGMDPLEHKHWFDTAVAEYGDVIWNPTNVDLMLADISKNATVKFEQLVYFFDSLDVPNLGEGNLKKLFDCGFETPESIIALSSYDISRVINSTVLGKKIYKGIQDKLQNIPVYKLMGAHSAFGRGIGTRKIKKLYDAFKGDLSLFEKPGLIVRVDGFDMKSAAKIVNGMPAFNAFLAEIKNNISISEYEAPKEGKFTGQSIIFTGFRSSELEQQIIEQGGKIATSVSKNTTLVVAKDPAEKSGKLDKARSLGVKIISLEEFERQV